MRSTLPILFVLAVSALHCTVPKRDQWRGLKDKNFPLVDFAFLAGGLAQADEARFVVEAFPWDGVAAVLEKALGVRITWPGSDDGAKFPALKMHRGRKLIQEWAGFEWFDLPKEHHFMLVYHRINRERNSVSIVLETETRDIESGVKGSTAPGFLLKISIHLFSPELFAHSRLPNMELRYPKEKGKAFRWGAFNEAMTAVFQRLPEDLAHCLEKERDCRVYKE